MKELTRQEIIDKYKDTPHTVHDAVIMGQKVVMVEMAPKAIDRTKKTDTSGPLTEVNHT